MHSDAPHSALCTPNLELLPPPAAPHTDSTGSQGGLLPSSPQNPPSTLQPPARKVSRNGKIARLPKLERDLVNRMLQNNLPYPKIVDALDEIGISVTQRNVSNWKTRGGYREWCLAQDHALQVRLFQDNMTDLLRKHDASEVPEIGLQLAATYLSEFFLKPEARQQLASDPEKYSRMTAALCRLSNQIHTLQKYRDESAKALGYKHNPELIKRQDEAELEIVRKTYSSKLGNSSKDPEIPHRNYLPKDC